MRKFHFKMDGVLILVPANYCSWMQGYIKLKAGVRVSERRKNDLLNFRFALLA